MKKNTTKLCLLGAGLALAVSVSSCKKNNLTQDGSTTANQTIMGAKSPDLNYEQLSMFSYGPSELIPAPWAGGIGKAFPAQYENDYRAADGWELYFNTFNNVTKAKDPYFIIYNRFRGVMRIYYYLDPKSINETDRVTFQLDLRGSSPQATVLNFEQGEIIDRNTLTTVTSKVQKELLIQSGSWYAEEFELAYDPALANTSYSANQLKWTMYSTTVDKIDLDGTQKGTIDGTIQVPQATSSFFGNLVKGAVSVGLGELGVLATGSKIASNFFSKKLGPLKLEDVKNGVTEASKGALKNGGKSIFNAVLGQLKGDNGGSGYSEQKVNLKINTNITLSGSIQHSPSGIFNPVVFLSNTQGLQTTAPDYIPNYSGSVGVFNLSGTPAVNVYSITPPVSPPSDVPAPKTWIYNYSPDESSFNVVFNPELIGSGDKNAKIENLKKEVIVKYNPAQITEYFGNIEYLNTDDRVLTGTSAEITYTANRNSWTPPSETYVRISFDVVPNNGSTPVKIIKTFKATINKRY